MISMGLVWDRAMAVISGRLGILLSLAVLLLILPPIAQAAVNTRRDRQSMMVVIQPSTGNVLAVAQNAPADAQGPIALTACVDASVNSCDAEALCPVRGRWNPVNDAIRDALASVSLADLTANPCQSHGRAALTAPPAVPAAAQ